MSAIRTVLAPVLTLALLAAPLLADAQPARKTARVGWLGWIGTPEGSPRSVPLEGLRSGLRDRGWVEGENLVLDVRTGEGGQARDLAAELVRSKVDVIVAQGPMVFGARAVAGSIPVVFGINGDPVEAGLVASLSRPGANLTGITALALELAGKRLQLLREAVPGVTRIAVLANASHPGSQAELRETQAAARRLGLSLQYVPVHSARDFDAAFEAITRGHAEAVVAFPDTLINRQAKAIAEFAGRRRIPAVSGWAEFAAAGNLMSYGPNLREFYRHMAVYVDKLLKGARPADLPVEQPTRFDLVINVKAARALGLSIAPSLLVQANDIIE
jgi:putative ABC transport system substrate-binding protein